MMVIGEVQEDTILLIRLVNRDFLFSEVNGEVEPIFKVVIDGLLSNGAVNLWDNRRQQVVNI